jgi:hypothetical protein
VHLGDDRKAQIDNNKCTGCGQCVAVCQFDAARVKWSSEGDTLSKKIAEYAYAAVKGKPALHVNFIMDVSPDCDCWGHNDIPIVEDIGIAASTDPVALDKACADMVNEAPSAWHLREKENNDDLRGADKFRMAHGNTDWNTGLLHGEKIKLGSLSYKLIRI